MSTPERNLRIDYLEFATRDVAAAKNFYTASFADGRMNGGFISAPDAPAKTNPMVVLFASNLEDAEARVEKAGGEIVKPSFEFPGGRRFEFTDPTGLMLAVASDVRADGTKIE